MFRPRFFTIIAITLYLAMCVSHASASTVPQVVVSIKPLHSLVAAVMGELGTPALIVKQAGSEHGYALKPSDATLLTNADVIFIADPDMEIFLTKPVESLGAKARTIALSGAPGLELLPIREGGLFESEEDRHDHGHTTDFHFWLDPENAEKVVTYIADVLSDKDAEHSPIYHENAVNYNKQLEQLEHNTQQSLSAIRDKKFIVFHDAYHYFERRFGLHAVGSVALDPERQPGAKRLSAIRQTILDQNVVCVFAEPQFPNKLVTIIVEDTPAKVGMLDPLGQTIPEGAALYPELIKNLGNNLVQCLSGN